MPSNEYFRVDGCILVMHPQSRWPQSTHRVAMATFWRTFHREGKISPAWWGGGCTPSPFHTIYHHEQSCGVGSSWEDRYTPPISTLPLYVLCGDGLQCEQIFCYLEPSEGLILLAIKFHTKYISKIYTFREYKYMLYSLLGFISWLNLSIANLQLFVALFWTVFFSFCDLGSRECSNSCHNFCGRGEVFFTLRQLFFLEIWKNGVGNLLLSLARTKKRIFGLKKTRIRAAPPPPPAPPNPTWTLTVAEWLPHAFTGGPSNGKGYLCLYIYIQSVVGSNEE